MRKESIPTAPRNKIEFLERLPADCWLHQNFMAFPWRILGNNNLIVTPFFLFFSLDADWWVPQPSKQTSSPWQNQFDWENFCHKKSPIFLPPGWVNSNRLDNLTRPLFHIIIRNSPLWAFRCRVKLNILSPIKAAEIQPKSFELTIWFMIFMIFLYAMASVETTIHEHTEKFTSMDCETIHFCTIQWSNLSLVILTWLLSFLTQRKGLRQDFFCYSNGWKFLKRQEVATRCEEESGTISTWHRISRHL